ALEVPKNRTLDPPKPVLPDESQQDLLFQDPLPHPPHNPLLEPPPYNSPSPPVLSPVSPTTPSAPTPSSLVSSSTPPSSPAPPELTPRTPPQTPRLRLRRAEGQDGPSTWQSSLF
nr:p15 protein [Baboon endogenous virus strain M7]